MEEALKKDGTLKRLKAELFAATAAVLQEPVSAEIAACLTMKTRRSLALHQETKPQGQPSENALINSLIHEYLLFNGMPGTARMLALGESRCRWQRATFTHFAGHRIWHGAGAATSKRFLCPHTWLD